LRVPQLRSALSRRERLRSGRIRLALFVILHHAFSDLQYLTGPLQHPKADWANLKKF